MPKTRHGAGSWGRRGNQVGGETDKGGRDQDKMRKACGPAGKHSPQASTSTPYRSIEDSKMVAVASLEWQDVMDGNFLDNPARTAWREAVAHVAERAKAALPEANGRIDAAVKM